ncbi:transposase [Hymenobacter properus]|uniref:Transposase n=1 Tax=Hymenobacter properus TaxID=2791026 RepID=A0A931BFC0_9BACT|nr:transposase [Hymenobacter properus]MBF9141486.1 transposase [Hymenobacter properus]MBR7720295.1 transposase [Microvirga sp. SRT04]
MTSLLTFRLHGTIPAATGRELQAELRQAQEVGTDHRRAQKQFFAKFDAVLDRGPIGPRYFENEKIAEVLAGEIMMLEETGFRVHAFAILPNHAHLVLELSADSSLSFAKAVDLLHLRTGTACRRLVRPKLPPEAEFWQVGWHEYGVQDAAELARLLTYVRGNARQAGLPARFQEWPYASE